jgi:MscS family membrane protein
VNLQIMERFNAEGIDFAFPAQTLHLAGDDKRPLTVGQRRVSEEEAFPTRAVPAQTAALGAQAVPATPPTSEFMRPQPKAPGHRTDAPLEEEVLLGDEEGRAGEAEDEGRNER